MTSSSAACKTVFRFEKGEMPSRSGALREGVGEIDDEGPLAADDHVGVFADRPRRRCAVPGLSRILP